jgi:glycosyltransferase involved in cell wall biosynthesis
MKIGITTFGADGGVSGISQYAMQLLREFEEIAGDHEIEVVMYEDEQAVFLPDPNSPLRGVPMSTRLRNPLVSIAWHQLVLPWFCKQRGYDVLFLPAANRRLPIWAPCPTVGTVHDFSSLHVDGKYDAARMFYIKQVLPLLARRLTTAVTVSEASRKDVVDYAGVPAEDCVVTSLAADTDVYYPRDRVRARAHIAEQYGIEGPYLLYVSRIEHPGKNHARLIRAFDRLKDAVDIPHSLVICGSDRERAEEVHAVADQMRHKDAIHFTGFAASEDLPWFYAASDAVVFPSLYEGFGLPVLEAMACGIPVAASDLSSLPEVVGSAGLLFDPYDEESIAQAMRALVESEELRADLSRRGIERASKFDWRQTASQTLDAIVSAGRRGRQSRS